MKVSVVMAVYNGGKYIRRQLESIMSQTRLPDEIIICDDRSADDTASGLYSGRNLGGSVFLGNGDLSGKSNPDPGTSWNFDPDTLWKAN